LPYGDDDEISGGDSTEGIWAVAVSGVSSDGVVVLVVMPKTVLTETC
jgi:hypothetical protein